MSAVIKVQPGTHNNSSNSAIYHPNQDLKAILVRNSYFLSDLAYFSEWVFSGDRTDHVLPAECIYKARNGAITVLIRK